MTFVHVPRERVRTSQGVRAHGDQRWAGSALAASLSTCSARWNASVARMAAAVTDSGRAMLVPPSSRRSASHLDARYPILDIV